MNIASYIEHTRLSPDTTLNQVENLCSEALQHAFHGVCIPPYFVPHTRKILGKNSPVKIVTVIGFPMGYHVYTSKAEEARKAMNDGAEELDMVINVAALKAGDYQTITNELDTLVTLSGFAGVVLKVIIESTLLLPDEIVKACLLCKEKKVNIVKTSTGMTGIPIVPETIRLIKNNIAPDMGIKASGGIKTQKDALALIQAGATRIGTSSGIQIIQE